MTLTVKMMGPEDAPDSDTRKTFRVWSDMSGVDFSRPDGKTPIMRIAYKEIQDNDVVESIEDFEVTGNVYVMNEAGKTIATFGPANIPTTKSK